MSQGALKFLLHFFHLWTIGQKGSLRVLVSCVKLEPLNSIQNLFLTCSECHLLLHVVRQNSNIIHEICLHFVSSLSVWMMRTLQKPLCLRIPSPLLLRSAKRMQDSRFKIQDFFIKVCRNYKQHFTFIYIVIAPVPHGHITHYN